MELDERKKSILKAVIKEYILTAEPIGSRTISKRYKLDISSATIRNEMSDLEEMGFLEQPHTSAGRIPSDKGYRFYVDSLMDQHEVPMSLEHLIKEKYLAKKQEVQEIFQAASRVLSNITRYTAIVASPIVKEKKFHHIQLVPLEGSRVLVVVIFGDGVVHKQMVNLRNHPRRDDLDKISRYINEKLHGLLISKIDKDLLNNMERELSTNILPYSNLYECIRVILSEGTEEDWEKVYLGGAFNILEQPEFSDVEKVKVVLKLFEQEEMLRKMLKEFTQEGVGVKIGRENTIEAIKNCSLVTADYYYDDFTLGKLAILGPTRMEYPKVIAVAELMARILTRVLQEEE